MVHIKKKKILKKKKEFLEDLSYRSKLGKLSSGHRTGKDQFSFQSLGKAMPKDAQTTAQLHSSHMLAKYCSKLSKLGFNSMRTSDVQARFRKGRGTRDQITNIHWITEKGENSRKTSTSAY